MKKNKKESVLDFMKSAVDFSDDTTVKENIKIHPQLEPYIFPLTNEEFEQLEANIVKEGCRDPLVIWQTEERENILVDGHNRFNICQKHGLDFKIAKREFADMQAVEDWMINNQLGRRNLTAEQASILRGRQYNRLKKGHGGKEFFESTPSGQIDHSTQKTSEKLAKAHKVSEKTIRRDGAFSVGMDRIRQVNPQFHNDIISKKVKLKRQLVEQLAKLPEDSWSALPLNSVEEMEAALSAIKAAPKPKPEAKIEQQKDKFLFHAKQLKKLGLNKLQLKKMLDELP